MRITNLRIIIIIIIIIFYQFIQTLMCVMMTVTQRSGNYDQP